MYRATKISTYALLAMGKNYIVSVFARIYFNTRYIQKVAVLYEMLTDHVNTGIFLLILILSTPFAYQNKRYFRIDFYTSWHCSYNLVK